VSIELELLNTPQGGSHPAHITWIMLLMVEI
jgi:hypothetical protein